MIDKDYYQHLIKSLNVGSTVAETDDRLEDARVETPVFSDVLDDKIDLILGTKGSGKTALFRLINFAQNTLLEISNTAVITGVEPTGDPVFKAFTKEFEEFTETDFENFWKIYFVTLINSDFILNAKFNAVLQEHTTEYRQLIKSCYDAGIPQTPKPASSFKDLVGRALAAMPRVKKAKAGIQFDAEKPTLFLPSFEMDFKEVKNETSRKPVFINEIGKALEDLLEATGINLWLLLDRLDVVFEHGSRLEFLALRGLLKAYESFQVRGGAASKRLKIKIFLRDDIFDFITSPDEFRKISAHKTGNLSALTHISARSTKPPLTWTKGQIQQFLLKRILQSPLAREYYKTNVTELEREDIRNEVWKKVFGEKIESGPKSSDSLSWIFTRLSDGRQNVTPRAALNFLQGCISEQVEMFNLNKIDQEHLFTPQAVKKGIVVASEERYVKETKNEYPLVVKYVEMLRGHGAKFSKSELKKLYGSEYKGVVFELERIGVLSASAEDYKVSFIFRAALAVHPYI